MSYDNILYDASEGIATITLHRPDKLNAYTTEMGDEVVDAFRKSRDDEAVRAIVLTGSGRGFCAGVDLEHLKAHQADRALGKGPRLGEEDFLRKLPLEMASCPKPLIAAVNGHAIGVGVTMILPCDVRIAVPGAKLGLTFAKLGILPGLGSTHLLPQIVGRGKALELVLRAEPIRAEEAERIGLVNQLAPAEALVDSARAMALSMAEARPEVLAAAKALVIQGQASTLAEAMDAEQRTSAEIRR